MVNEGNKRGRSVVGTASSLCVQRYLFIVNLRLYLVQIILSFLHIIADTLLRWRNIFMKRVFIKVNLNVRQYNYQGRRFENWFVNCRKYSP
jgi:hypothetical protein